MIYRPPLLDMQKAVREEMARSLNQSFNHMDTLIDIAEREPTETDQRLDDWLNQLWNQLHAHSLFQSLYEITNERLWSVL